MLSSLTIKSLTSIAFLLNEMLFGAHGAGDTPVLIPNTEVKPSSGDYTALAGN